MNTQIEWWVWPLGVAVIALVVFYFWHTATAMWGALRYLVQLIDRWPEIRRNRVEAEAQAGGRVPTWLGALRVLLVVTLAVCLLWLLSRKLGFI